MGASFSYSYSFTITGVSIHAPAMGARNPLLSMIQVAKFQSTHPRWVRVIRVTQRVGWLVFQSTHPRWVRAHTGFHRVVQVRFNPRTRDGCEGWPLSSSSGVSSFQSTHPRWVREIDVINQDLSQVSIHAPAMGAR